jgi:hypothetical protein
MHTVAALAADAMCSQCSERTLCERLHALNAGYQLFRLANDRRIRCLHSLRDLHSKRP